MDLDGFEPVSPPSSFPIKSEETFNKKYRLWLFEAPADVLQLFH